MGFCNIRRTNVAWFWSGVAPVGTLGRRCLYFSENQRSAKGCAGFGRLRLVGCRLLLSIVGASSPSPYLHCLLSPRWGSSRVCNGVFAENLPDYRSPGCITPGKGGYGFPPGNVTEELPIRHILASLAIGCHSRRSCHADVAG